MIGRGFANMIFWQIVYRNYTPDERRDLAQLPRRIMFGLEKKNEGS